MIKKIKERRKDETILSSSVGTRLDMWEKKGIVVYHDRYNAGKIQAGYSWITLCKDGHCDRIAFINVKQTCWVYLIECKDEDGEQTTTRIVKRQDGTIRVIGGQDAFESKFNGLINVVYEIVRVPSQVDATIERITNYTDDILKNIKI